VAIAAQDRYNPAKSPNVQDDFDALSGANGNRMTIISSWAHQDITFA
jgi:hypothetical protein